MPLFIKIMASVKRTFLFTYVLSCIIHRIWYKINKCMLFDIFKNEKSIILCMRYVMSNEIIIISHFIKIQSKLLEKYGFYLCWSFSIIISLEIDLFFYKVLSEDQLSYKIFYISIVCTKFITFLFFITFYNFNCK